MTKSQPSATKLRLSRLVRCLIALGCIKLAIMGVALFDLPMPSWGVSESKKEIVKEEAPREVSPLETAELASGAGAPVQTPSINNPATAETVDLASLARPRASGGFSGSILPAPLVNEGAKTAAVPSAFTPKLPTPPSPGLPLAKAGIILPRDESLDKKNEPGVWDMLNLKSLPIPGLGSSAIAHAAALDMPVPNTPPRQSPFTPAEQLPGPGASASLPVPANSGASGDNAWIPDPHNSITDAPAPNIARQSSPLDPNMKTQELARQQQDMLMLRQQMDQRLKDLQTAEDKMKEMLKEANNIEDQKVRNLIQMYSNMKPRMAAQAMEKMDERIAVRILSGMPPKQSGEILTYTNPAKTAKFTEMITRLKMREF